MGPAVLNLHCEKGETHQYSKGFSIWGLYLIRRHSPALVGARTSLAGIRRRGLQSPNLLQTQVKRMVIRGICGVLYLGPVPFEVFSLWGLRPSCQYSLVNTAVRICTCRTGATLDHLRCFPLGLAPFWAMLACLPWRRRCELHNLSIAASLSPQGPRLGLGRVHYTCSYCAVKGQYCNYGQQISVEA